MTESARYRVGTLFASVRPQASGLKPQASGLLALAFAALLLLAGTLRAGDPGAVGDLYVTGASTDNVVQFDGQTGAFVCEFVPQVKPPEGPGENFSNGANGLAFGPNGNLFVVSRYAQRVREFDGQTGAVIGDATPVDPPVTDNAGPSGNWLAQPYDLLFLPDGRLVVDGTSNEALMTYDVSAIESLGTFAIGGSSPGGYGLGQFISLGPNGHVFAVDADKNQVLEFHPTTGRLVRVFVDGEGVIDNPKGLAFGPNGNMFVISFWDNAVLEFDGQSGAFLGTFASGGGLLYPQDLTFGPNGNLFVTGRFDSYYGPQGVMQYDGTTGAVIGTFASVSDVLLLYGASALTFKPPPPDALPAPTISGVSVASHDACDPLTGVTVTGTNLDAEQTQVMLKNPNEPLGTNGLVVTYVGQVTGGSGDGTSLTVDFDLDGGARMPGGAWDVVVENPDGQVDTLSAAIDVAPCWTAGEGNLFVLGYRYRIKGRHGLFEFDGDSGNVIGLVVEDPTLDGDDLGGATGFVFGHDGNLLITSNNPDDGSVLKYDGITGQKMGTIIPPDTGGMLRPTRLAFGPNANLFVLHKGIMGSPSGVLEFDGLAGAFVRDFVPLATCGLLRGGAFEFACNGNLYVTEHTDPAVGPNGGVYVFDGQSGECLAAPLVEAPSSPGTAYVSLAFAPHDGNLLLPLASPPSLGQVAAHDPETGDLLATPIPPPAGGIQQAHASDFGLNGHLFVAGYSSHVFEYDLLSGETLGIFATNSPGQGSASANEVQFKPLLGDADDDWDRDLADFAALQRAFGGPGVTPANYNDLIFDHDRDGDVDLDDFSEFAERMTPPRDWSAPPGACCLPDASCVENTTARQCVIELGGSWLGYGSTCAEDCPAFGACCYDDGTCIEQTAEQCEYHGGMYQGDGSDCATTVCPFAIYHNEIDPAMSYAPSGDGLQLADDMTLEGDPAALDLAVATVEDLGPFDVTIELWDACPGDGGTPIPNTTFTWNGVPGQPYTFYILQVDPVSPVVTIPDTVWMVATFTTPESGWIIAEQAEIGTTADLYARNVPPWACNYWFGGDPYAGLWANLRCVEGEAKRSAAGDGETQLRIERIEGSASSVIEVVQ